MKRVLYLLTSVNYLNYIDRYILAAVLVSIQADLGLNDFQGGLLATAFMVPYMFTAPIFGWMGDKYNRLKILGSGVAVWSIATVFTGLAKNFPLLFSSRALLGLGESAFTTTAVSVVSDAAKADQRGKDIAIFSTALPVGAALGYVLGGLLAEAVGWRGAFLLVGFPGLILCYFIFKTPEPTLEKTSHHFDVRKTMGTLFKSRCYALGVFGYCAYTFVVGGVAHWIPSFMQRTFAIDQLKANLLFGGVAVVSGLVGTLLGGYWGDLWNKKGHGGHLKISSTSMFLSAPFFIACVYSDSLVLFMIFLVLTQFFFFLSTSPINVAILEAAPGHLKNSAMAIAIFACHILGDAISSPLIGRVSDMTGSIRDGMLVCAPVTILSALLWMWAAREKH